MTVSRPKVLQVLALAAIATIAAACSAATPAPPIPSPAAATSSAADADGAAATTSADSGSLVGDVAAACDAMVTVNALQPPGTDPDGPAVTAAGADSLGGTGGITAVGGGEQHPARAR